MNRTLKAFLISPLVPVAIIILLNFYSELTRPHPFNEQRLLNQTVFIGIFGTIVSFAVTVIIGLPIYYWFRRKGWLGFRAIVSATFLIGVAFTFFTAVFPYLPFNASEDGLRSELYNQCQVIEDGILTPCGYRQKLLEMLQTGLLATSVGITFWWIVRPKRQPEIAENNPGSAS